MTRTRRSPGTKSRATSTPPSDNSHSNGHGDIQADTALAGVNADLWAALFSGEMRLAIRCSRCGRWLTAGPSKRKGIGAHCEARAVQQ